MQGKNIPLGTAVPEVRVVKTNQNNSKYQCIDKQDFS